MLVKGAPGLVFFLGMSKVLASRKYYLCYVLDYEEYNRKSPVEAASTDMNNKYYTFCIIVNIFNNLWTELWINRWNLKCYNR